MSSRHPTLQRRDSRVAPLPRRYSDSGENGHKRLVRRMSSFETMSTAPVIFSLRNEVGALNNIISLFRENDIQVRGVELRKPQRKNSEVELFVDCEGKKGMLRELIQQLNEQLHRIEISEEDRKREATIDKEMKNLPWFPKKISELDKSSNNVLMFGEELDADHPGYRDVAYRERRKMFAQIAAGYRHGMPITRIEFTEEETDMWNQVFRELQNLYPTHACKEYMVNFKTLCDEGIYKFGEIPQLEDISVFLKERTGFQVRPVAGYLSPRDFLAGLAFRVFHSTQYIRHPTNPLYTPEPDSIHDIIGHVPMLADRSFAQFSQEIGLASLGAAEADVTKLASCYFFTVEFGLCKQDGQLRAYGAGLLSSISELKFALSPTAIIKPFNPIDVIHQECRITTFQDSYFQSESFPEAKKQIREYAASIQRPFGLRYDPYTQSVEVMKNSGEIMNAVDELKDDLEVLNDALSRIQSI